MKPSIKLLSLGAAVIAIATLGLLAADYTTEPPPVLPIPSAPVPPAFVYSGSFVGRIVSGKGITNSAGFWSDSGLLAQTNSNGYVQFDAGGVLRAYTVIAGEAGTDTPAGAGIVRGNFIGNGSSITNLHLNGPTNSAPSDTGSIKAWVVFTNSSGGVFRLPLYQ